MPTMTMSFEPPTAEVLKYAVYVFVAWGIPVATFLKWISCRTVDGLPSVDSLSDYIKKTPSCSKNNPARGCEIIREQDRERDESIFSKIPTDAVDEKSSQRKKKRKRSRTFSKEGLCDAKLSNSAKKLSNGVTKLSNRDAKLMNGAKRLKNGPTKLSNDATKLPNSGAKLTNSDAQFLFGTDKFLFGDSNFSLVDAKSSNVNSDMANGDVTMANCDAEMTDWETKLANCNYNWVNGDAKLVDGNDEMANGDVKDAHKVSKLSSANLWETFCKFVPDYESGNWEVLPVNGEATKYSERGLNVQTSANNYDELVPNGGTNEDVERRLNLNSRTLPIDTRVYRARFVPICS